MGTRNISKHPRERNRQAYRAYGRDRVALWQSRDDEHGAPAPEVARFRAGDVGRTRKMSKRLRARAVKLIVLPFTVQTLQPLPFQRCAVLPGVRLDRLTTRTIVEIEKAANRLQVSVRIRPSYAVFIDPAAYTDAMLARPRANGDDPDATLQGWKAPFPYDPANPAFIFRQVNTSVRRSKRFKSVPAFCLWLEPTPTQFFTAGG